MIVPCNLTFLLCICCKQMLDSIFHFIYILDYDYKDFCKDRLSISFPIWKPIITGIPIWMRWRTSASFVNPRTKSICSIIVSHIHTIYVMWKDEHFIYHSKAPAQLGMRLLNALLKSLLANAPTRIDWNQHDGKWHFIKNLEYYKHVIRFS